MHFEVLGPLRVHVDGGEVAARAGRDRVLLATLLLYADRTVTVDQLVDALWSDAPPRSARNQVQACVSQLRKRLSQAGLPDDILTTDPAGYRLRVDLEQVDVHRFRALVNEARAEAAAGRRAEARDRYRAALSLWRGPALAGIESAEVRRAAAALDEEHVQAVEERVELDLALGGAGELVGELTDLVQRYPYREGLHAALMRALYRAGRMADALAAFRQARRVLRDELGAEPGEELQRLHQAILNRDRQLTIDPEPRRPAAAVAPVPRELPPEVSYFVGRDREIAQVRDALVLADRASRRRPAVVVLYGPGGVGKSALAVRVAHELADEFPDGQLYVDLCGSTPGMRPLAAVEVLARFLRSLAVHPSEIPSEWAEAATMFRSVIADRRLLLVLDNAASKHQVSPLLPSTPRCAVLVTSRNPQPSLDVDQRLRVGILGDVDGLALLTGLTDGLTDTAAARTILTLTGGLPLAIRIVGGRLACRPDLPVAEYVARLADRSRRLDELQLDDLAVRACVRTSYDALQASRDTTERLAAQAFRMLGLLYVPDVAPGVIAAMINERRLGGVQAALDRLVDAQLVESSSAGLRYRLHDLVRLVAAECALDYGTRDERQAAIACATSFYAAGVHRVGASIRISTIMPFNAPEISHDGPAPVFAGREQARKWLDSELPSIVSILEQITVSASTNSHFPLWLSLAIWNSLDVRCAWQQAHRLSERMLIAASNYPDQDFAACAFLLHGRSEACLGRYRAAAEHLERALKIFSGLDNKAGVALALNGLAVVSFWRGEPDVSLVHYEAALEIAQQGEWTDFTAVLHENMSASYACLGKLDRAVVAAECSVAEASRETQIHPSSALLNLAAAHCLRGSQAEAVRRADEAVHVSQETGDRMRECEAWIIRCEANLRQGRASDAFGDADRACELAQTNGYRYALAVALEQRSRVLNMMGRLEEAEQHQSLVARAFTQVGRTHRDPLLELLVGR